MEKKRWKISNRVKLMAAVCLLALLSLGGTMAYMTAHGSVENRFTVGTMDFNLYERHWDGELPDGIYGTLSNATPSVATPGNATPSNALGIEEAKAMYAGKRVAKDPAVKNNSKIDAYLRLAVRIPVAEVVTADEDGDLNNGGYPEETELFSYELNRGTGMKLLNQEPEVDGDYHVYWYIYTGGGEEEIPLPAGRDIPPLFDSVTFANVVEGQLEGELAVIRVDFQAIQSGGFDGPEEAWAAYGSQKGGE